MTNLLINIFSFSLIASAAMVIIANNPLHSVLFLVASFLSSFFLLFIIGNEQLALFFLIIYLGAIAVLFLFVTMMLNIKHTDLQLKKFYFPAGALIGGIFLVKTLKTADEFFLKNPSKEAASINAYLNWYDTLDSSTDILSLGQILYTQYLLQIMIAGLILYIAVIGVACLTIKASFIKTSKGQSLSRQLSRKNTL